MCCSTSVETQRISTCRTVNFLKLFLSDFKNECSPGPKYSINPRVTRGGLDGTPVYSILGQQKDQRK